MKIKKSKMGYWENSIFHSYQEESLLKKIRDKEQELIIKEIRKGVLK
jgi:hypothetical protein